MENPAASRLRPILDDPEALEALFQSDEAAFRREFARLPDAFAAHPAARFWRARLAFHPAEAVTDPRLLPRTLILCLLAGALLSVLFEAGVEERIQRNLAFVFFPGLCAFFLLRRGASWGRYAAFAAAFGAAALYINLLPAQGPHAKDTLLLACVFLSPCLWCLAGIAHAGWRSTASGRMEYLRFNGDLIVLGAVLGIAGGLLSALTFALFSLIEVDIEEHYRHVVYFGAASLPLVAAYLLEARRAIVRQVSTVVARLFAPIALAILILYLVLLLATGRNPYLDRDYLITFNFVLAAVLALVVYSAADGSGHRGHLYALLGLCLVALVLNGIALSAILFRITEFGTTPNRAAVLGSNLLFFTHLALILRALIRAVRGGEGLAHVQGSVTAFLPAYAAWSLCVVGAFPALFRLL